MKIHTATALLCLVGACTTPALKDGDPFDARDPGKSFNQAIFNFNLGADKHVIKPVAEGYHELPNWTRLGIGNFLSNLGEPSNFVNGLLQLNPDLTFRSFWRFTLNSTIGFGGLRDFAGENGLRNKDTNFGETLGRYGVDEGAYVVLPLAGPSTLRDTTGVAVDWFLDPVGWYMNTTTSIAQTVANGIDTRDSDAGIINHLYYDSLEPYSATRAAYLQHQAFK